MSEEFMSRDDIWSLINRRRRQILVHSCIYYRLDSNILTDQQFDRIARHLVGLQKKFPDIAAECPFHEAFIDFDGTTGFHLPLGDPAILYRATKLLEYHKKEKKGM